MKRWMLQTAKNKFSEVVRRALSEGPQRILRRNDVVVILSEETFERLVGGRRGFKELLLNGPGLDTEDLERDQSPMRDVNL